MNELIRALRKNPVLLIGTAAVVGLALGTGIIPVPGLRPPAPAPAAPAVPPPPPDPLDAY